MVRAFRTGITGGRCNRAWRQTINPVIVAALLATCPATASAQERQGSLEARVIQSETQRPMADVSVALVSRDGARYEVRTDAQGRALLDHLSEGLYTVRVSAPGRLTVEEPSVRIVANRILPFDVALQPLPQDILELEEVRVTARAIPTDPFGTVSESFRNREELRVAPGPGVMSYARWTACPDCCPLASLRTSRYAAAGRATT